MKRRICDERGAHARLRPATRRRQLVLAGLVGLALLAGGCVTTGPLDWIRNGLKVGPNYCRPPAPVAKEWIDAKNPNVQSRRLEFIDWWSVFRDPRLNSLIGFAYDQNLNLRVVGTRVLQARAQQAIAVGNVFPQTQTATGSYSRVGLSRNAPNNPTVLTPLLQEITNRLGIPSTGQGAFTNFYSDWKTGFNLSWELDFWGRFRRAIESANANLDASVENYDAALVTLLADVATNYVQFRIFQQRLKIARSNVAIQERILALTEQQANIGVRDRLPVLQARTVLEQTRSTIPALEIGQRQANNALCVLLGMPPCDLEPLLGPGTELNSDPMASTPTTVAAGIPADLIRRRPDVRGAERQIAAQSAQIGVAEADLYPAIVIDGMFGWEAQDIAKLFSPGSFTGNITPNFHWNILNYGRIVNNVHLQDARLQELIATYQNRVLTAGQEVENALVGFLRSQEQTKSLADSVKAASAATELGEKQYKAGTIPFNTVFNLETAQVQQQDQLAVAQGNVALNLINVYRALGGGWELRLEKDKAGAGPALGLPQPEAAAAETEQLPAPRPAKEK